MDFVNNVEWDRYADDEDVLGILSQLKEVVDEFGGDDDEDNARAKLVVVGDGAVGKTCLLISFATDNFPEEYVPTVFENYTARMQYKGETIYLALWDTAGQEDYDRLRPLSYPGTDVVLLCFSVVSEASYDAIADKWSPEINHYLADVPHILVGTKVDLRDAKIADPNVGEFECITKEQGEELAKEIGAVCYVEASAKTRKGLENVFQKALDAVIADRRSKEEEEKPKEKSRHKKSSHSKKKEKSSKSSSKSKDKEKKSSSKSSKSKDKKEEKKKSKSSSKSKDKEKHSKSKSSSKSKK